MSPETIFFLPRGIDRARLAYLRKGAVNNIRTEQREIEGVSLDGTPRNGL